MAAMWCRLPVSIFPSSPASSRVHPGAAWRRGTAFAVPRAAAQLTPPELTPTCRPARFSTAENSEGSLGGLEHLHTVIVSSPPESR